MSVLKWSNFAYKAVTELAGVKPHENALILADTNTDMELAQTCLAMALTQTPQAQLLVIRRVPSGEKSELNPVTHQAIAHADIVIALCESMIVQTNAVRECCAKGGRLISTVPVGIEEYVIKGVSEVDFAKMSANAELMAKLWREAKVCRVTSDLGTDFSFEFQNRPVVVGDGGADHAGEVDFFPGIQVNVAPVEETLNGVMIIDGSVSPGGLVNAPIKLTLEKGKITNFEGGTDANMWSAWLSSFGDPKIYELAHFSVGLNPKAKMSGNMIEDERVVGAITVGFGNQTEELKGKVGNSRFHVDAVIASSTIYLDGKIMCENNKLNKELGFVAMI